jgi:hypothetical protein
MGGLSIIAKDKKGNVTQDLNVSRDIKSEKIVEVNKLKEEDERRRNKTNIERSEEIA